MNLHTQEIKRKRATLEVRRKSETQNRKERALHTKFRKPTRDEKIVKTRTTTYKIHRKPVNNEMKKSSEIPEIVNTAYIRKDEELLHIRFG